MRRPKGTGLAVRIMAATGNPVRPRGQEETQDVVSTQAQITQSLLPPLQVEENPGLGRDDFWCESGRCATDCHALASVPGMTEFFF